ncbi:MAG: MFS transporter [Proteobacteria bacterium]|nr:MFS transporter [Pseudomonadota bacterium]
MNQEQPIIPASPAENLVADAEGLAELFHAPKGQVGDEISAEGGRAASKAGQWGWALYEAARDPNVLFQIYIISPFFATVMMSDPVRGQIVWGQITTYSGWIAAALAPFFGAIADKGGPRKPWLAVFSAFMVLSFAGTYIGVPNSSETMILLVGAIVVVNNVVFELSNAFHASMLSGIASHSRIGGLSGLAFALGNASGFLLLILFFVTLMAPGAQYGNWLPSAPMFGVDATTHVPERLAGPISAVWMLLLAIPLFLFTPDRLRGTTTWWQAMKGGVGSLHRTIRSLRHYRNVAHYIGARAIFNDGMTGVLTFSGIYAAGTFGWNALDMTAYGIELSIFAALGGFFGSWLDDNVGSKRALFISIGGTAVSFALALTMGPDRVFWFFPVDPQAAPLTPLHVFSTWPEIFYLIMLDVTAFCIVAGYANTRTMMARIAPAEKMTEFFGLMSFSGTAATFLAPMAVAWLTWWTQSQRGGMIAVVALLLAGLVWLNWVKEERAVAV